MARRLMMTAFGWNDPGGGTTVPRLAAKELARRGWEVTVFHAAVKPAAGEPAYHLTEWEDDGVRLVGVHNRPHGLWDRERPLRELDDPPITAAFAAQLDRVAPDVVHFHNLHNLGAALIDETATRGIPSWFTTHNYWLICPRAYLMTADGTICAGPGDGRRCATCTGGQDPSAYARRLADIRARMSRGVTGVLAVSEAVRRTLLGAGYPAEMVDVVRQGMPHDTTLWERLGRDRRPGRAAGPDGPLTVAFLGSAYPHKGPQLLIEAAQRTQTPVRVLIHGEVPDVFAPTLRALDVRGVCELRGTFATDELEDVLGGVDVAVLPSMWWDCAPLAAAECLAARVPLVVPRLGGLAEAVRDGVDGLVVDPLDVDALAAALDRLSSEPGLLERLQGGIEPPHAFDAYVDELEDYYASERPSRVPAVVEPDVLAVLCEGESSALEMPGAAAAGASPDARGAADSTNLAAPPAFPRIRIQRLGSADPPLPHAADVELRTAWPPARRAASSGRLVVVQPAGAAQAPLPPLDELWVADEVAREGWIGAGLDPELVVAQPSDPVTRLRTLAAHAPRSADPAAAEPWPLAEQVELHVLATPAWRGADRLAMLLARWCAATTAATSACLYLLADPAVDGTPAAIEQRVLAACQASGADLDAAADVTVLLEPATAERDARLHAAMDAYVPLHPACVGHERLARGTGSTVVPLDGHALAEAVARHAGDAPPAPPIPA
ncbi:MAG TPA: glycosyltransferase [Conexibacter sp.]|jgi:glycosyltransferase involved in cell wall biosynthesis|nr:glycosyltransferase [Conexibacter sp.]